MMCSLKIELANYRELQAFSQFGSDLDAATKNVLEQGEKTMEVLKQAQYDILSVEDEVLELVVEDDIEEWLRRI